jgi:hypothetical protein
MWHLTYKRAWDTKVICWAWHLVNIWRSTYPCTTCHTWPPLMENWWRGVICRAPSNTCSPYKFQFFFNFNNFFVWYLYFLFHNYFFALCPISFPTVRKATLRVHRKESFENLFSLFGFPMFLSPTLTQAKRKVPWSRPFEACKRGRRSRATDHGLAKTTRGGVRIPPQLLCGPNICI